MKAFVVVGLLVLVAAPAAAADLYVAPDGKGDGSLKKPASLRTALSLAASNFESDTLRLRKGTYDASGGAFTYRSPPDGTLPLTLLGGWNDDYTERDAHPTATRLTGGGTSRVLKLVAAVGTQDFTVTLDRLTVENGSAPGQEGAGILAFNTGGATLRLVLRDCWIRDNAAAGGAGGGLSVNCPLTVTGGQFVSNRALRGGALLLKGSPSLAPRIEGTVFSNNSSGAGGRGSAVESLVSPTFVRCTFRGPTNPLSTSGPGATLYAGAGSTLTVLSSVFRGCRTDDDGSAIRADGAAAVIGSTLFADCRAGQSAAGGRGALDLRQAGSAAITNCTFAGCRSLTDSAGAILSTGSSPMVRNTIFWSSGSQSFLNTTPALATATAATCYTDVTFASGFVASGGGNTESATANPFAGPGDYHLAAGSPGVDAGDMGAGLTVLDADGFPRVVDGDGSGTAEVDLGAFERQPNLDAGAGLVGFGRVPIETSLTVALSLANTGAAELHLGTIEVAGDPAGEFLVPGASCSGRTLAPGESCTLSLRFTPTIVGRRSATLTIPSDDPDAPITEVALSGEGVSRPELAPPAGSFGSEVTIRYFGFGAKRGRVEIRPAESPLDAGKLKVLEWSDSSIRVRITRKLAPGAFELVVRPAETPEVIAVEGFTYVGPRVDGADRAEGLPGDVVTISGGWFAYRRSKARLLFEYVDARGRTRRKRCRLVKKSRLFDPVLGTSRLAFRLRRVSRTSPTTGRLLLKTVLGEPVAAEPFTVR